MRVLFCAIPEKTTMLHMVPLAWALRTAGHEVVVASSPGFVDTVTRAGLTAVGVGREASIWRVEGLDPETLELGRNGLPLPWSVVQHPDDTPWDDLVHGQRNAVVRGHKPENFPIIAGVVEFARSWRPDLVVWEPLSYAGAIAAKACGAVHARMLWSIDVLGGTRAHYRRLEQQQPESAREDPLADWLDAYARKYGGTFSEDMTVGHFTIDQMPPSVRLAADGVDTVPIRYVPYGGPAVLAPWLWERPDSPRVALTLGTTSTERFGGYSFSVDAALEALSDLDIEVVATIADSQRPSPGRVPDNVRIVPFVPLDALAATCSLVINHCGPGTYLTTARHAVPQLHLPWDFDEPELARRAAATGASVSLHGYAIEPGMLRDHVRWLLADDEFRTAADALRTEIAGMPSPNAVAADLEGLVARHR